VHLPVQSGSARVLKMMAREYTPEWYLERIAWIKARGAHLDFDGHHRRLSGRDRRTTSSRPWTSAEVEYDCVFGFKYSARPNTPALTMIDSIPEAEKAKRLQVLLDRQREIQRVNYAKHIGQVMEVMVEGQNPARGQVSGRSSQNKPVNFTCAQPIAPAPGSYLQVKITGGASEQSGGRSRLRCKGACWREEGKLEAMDIEVGFAG
jgi:tRNA-2-methylthio-N6-dimethylallyladenosine synthase